MSTTLENKWQGAYSIESSATPEAIWRLFADVSSWQTWNAGVETIDMKGPFVAGTEFVMTPPGQEPFTSRLIEVRENERFVDETRVEDLVIVVTHQIERLNAQQTKITYLVEATGPDCAEIGPAVSADFPDVLKALVALAESSL